MPDYTVYGLVVRSDRPLDALDAAPAGSAADVQVVFGDAPPSAAAWRAAAPYYQSVATPEEAPAVVVRRDAAGGYWFRYDDGTEFVLDRSATRIAAWWGDATSLADTATYLLGPVLGFALRRRGVLALHASAVLLKGRAVALVGPSGAGKSTTAAAFARAGVPVLADDVVAVREVRGELRAYPSYRLLRLWDESERILFGTRGQLPLLTPTWEKRSLPLGAEHPFHREAAPLGDVFLLESRSRDERAPWVQPVPPRAAFMRLLENTYANYLLDDQMRAEEMRTLARVLLGRRVRALVPHSDPRRLEAMVALVRASVAAPARG
ncbi:MAG: hypothetical protein ACYC7F_06810 [Gemmatimonadaceae bacterium]